jgi:ABC-2 type transport system ATP-binding protein
MTGVSEMAVSVNGLVKRYKDFSMGPISLNLTRGYVYGLVGQNGAGKTTLLKSLMNLVRPDEGQIKLFGLDYTGAEKAIKEQIGFVPEDPFVYQSMNAKWLGRFISAYFNNWNQDEYETLLKSLDVDLNKSVKNLSRGTRVKLQLALALAHRPNLLILDEPTSGLDPLVRREILDQLASVVQDETRSVIFSTHITEDVERVADYIVFMVQGRTALVSDRESLRDMWQELIVDGDDMNGLPGLVGWESAGGKAVKITTYDASKTLEWLRKRGRSLITQRPLGLDEILGFLVKEEKGWSK